MIAEDGMIDPNLYPQHYELTTNEAAAAAKRNRRTIVAWIHRGHLKAMQNPGARGHYRIVWCDLYAVLHTPAVPKGQ